MNPIIKINNLTVLYDKGMSSEVRALDSVNLEIYPNEFLIILGPSGCGKSTLLYAMAGIEKRIEETSEVWIRGKNLVKMSSAEMAIFHRKQMGMIFQAFNLTCIIPRSLLRGHRLDKLKVYASGQEIRTQRLSNTLSFCNASKI